MTNTQIIAKELTAYLGDVVAKSEGGTFAYDLHFKVDTMPKEAPWISRQAIRFEWWLISVKDFLRFEWRLLRHGSYRRRARRNRRHAETVTITRVAYDELKDDLEGLRESYRDLQNAHMRLQDRMSDGELFVA